MTEIGGQGWRFRSTEWSMVQLAVGDGSGAPEAMASLIERYWKPAYAFVRSSGRDVEDAKDLTQAFFTRLLETDGLAGVDRERGTFRSYLLGALKHFLADAARAARAQKRGGGVAPLSLDYAAAESDYALLPLERESPERAFDRRWACLVIGRALAATREALEGAGRATDYRALELSLGPEPSTHAATARLLGLEPTEVAGHLRRGRRALRQALLREILPGLPSHAEAEAELDALFDALEPA